MTAVMRVADCDLTILAGLLQRYQLHLQLSAAGENIPGSYWGESEAGLVGNRLYARADTPVHSVLHEACHFICMDARRRTQLNRDAGGDDAEENAVCYLQIMLADELPAIARDRMMRDMDSWGYTFRLGSARAWFEQDASDAREWLIERGLLDATGVTWRLRS